MILITAPRGPMQDCAPIPVRAVATKAPDSERTIPITSLCDMDAITRSDSGALYRLRWNHERFDKLEKGVYLSQGQFHCKSVDGVMQEIYTRGLFVAITRYTMASAGRKTGVPYEALSPKSGCLGFGAYVFRLLLASSKADVSALLQRLLARIVRTRDPARPGRRFPRRSFIPSRRWGPKGRRGG